MKRILVLCYFLITVSPAFAQTLPFKRNDNHATVLQGNNGQPMPAGSTSTGQLFIKNIEDPISVSPGVATVVEDDTNPTVANNTSVAVLIANPDRVDCEVQNNLESDICVSGEGGTLTSVTPGSSNPCKVLVPQAVFTCGAPFPTKAAITVYQSSGSSTNLISVSEKE